jgi:hypothetical protein
MLDVQEECQVDFTLSVLFRTLVQFGANLRRVT